ncbi:4671_t:CDS:2, partial [Gigaspora margarita]
MTYNLEKPVPLGKQIEKGSTENSKLEKEQQIWMKELLKRNKDLFVEGLTQLGRIKKKLEVEQMIKYEIVQESTSLWSLPMVLKKK